MKSIPGRKILVRSAGYRIGKSQAEREHYYNVAVEGVNFAEIFIDELIPEAEAGYAKGLAFQREKYAEQARANAKRQIERYGRVIS